MLCLYFKAFSKIIFDDSLTFQSCLLRFITADGDHKAVWERERQEKNWLGYCETIETLNGFKITVIDIYQDFKFRANPEAEFHNYLETLLREMSLAWLGIFRIGPVRSFTVGWSTTGHRVSRL